MNFFLLQFHSVGTLETRRKWEIKIPIPRTEVLPQLLANYHAALPPTTPYLRIHPAYIGRKLLFRGVIPAFLALVLTFNGFGKDAFWVLLWIPLIGLTSWLFQKKFRLHLHPDVLQVHRSVFGKEEVLLAWNRVQSVKITQGLYQRKKGLASVHLYTAGGVIMVPFIQLTHARNLRDYALFKVESVNS